MSSRRSSRTVTREERARRRRTHARVCVSCRRVRPKAEMIRVARTDAGGAVDKAGVAPGRGAYVCHDPSCVALARRRLAGALRAPRLNVEAVVREIEEVRA